MSREAINDWRLSHHRDEEIDRCFIIRWRSKGFYFCTRCWAGLLGFLVSACCVPFGFYLSPWLMLAIPIDWLGYIFFGYKGTNAIRAFSGFLIGWFYVINAVSVVTWDWTWSLLLMDVILFLLVAVGIIAVFSKRMQEIRSKLTQSNGQDANESTSMPNA
jgi:hypothetical protein